MKKHLLFLALFVFGLTKAQVNILPGKNGGTGIANTGKTITLGGNLTLSGAFASIFTMTAPTTVTFPTSGILATLAGIENFTNKTGNVSMWTNDAGYLTSSSGVPSARTLTINGTAFDLSANRTWTVGDALVANPLSQFAATTSAQLAATISNETGTGILVFNNTPSLTTPIISSPTINLSGDAAGDIYYRASTTALTRLGIGSSGQVLTVSAGLPSWQTSSATIGGSAALNQVAYGSGANTIQGNSNFLFDGTSLSLNGSAGVASPLYVTANGTLRDNGNNSALEIASTVANPFPFIYFGNQLGSSRIGGLSWTVSSSGNNFANTQGEIVCYEPTANNSALEFYTNQNRGTTAISAVCRMVSLGGTGQLYIGGAVQPSANLTIAAGANVANGDPIKLNAGTFTSGGNISAGTIGYDGTTLRFTNSGLQPQELIQSQQSRVTTQFDQTTSTTLTNVPGLTATLVAGKTYRFEATLFVNKDAIGGEKYTVSGTCTATSIIYEILAVDNTGNLNTITSTRTALNSSAGQASGTSGYTKITGLITVNTAGTLTVQFAQNASNGTSSVLAGSTFIINQIN